MAELLLKSALYDMGKDGENLTFGYNEYGKPYLLNYPEIHFNFSHSGDYVICAVSDSEVGCDIERIEKIDLKVAKRFFCEEEYNGIISKTDEKSKQKMFFRYWTVKESYIKAIGTGLKTSLRDFSVTLDNSDYCRTVGKADDCFFTEFGEIEGYCCAFCKLGKIGKVKLHKKFF